jgi:ribosome-associated translation inhibitor RaiA
MIIQLNTDHNAHFGEKTREEYTSLVKEELSRYSDHITSVQIYLKDENAAKTGTDDKRCLIEAHYEGKAPIVATHNADNYELAIGGALDTLKGNLARVKEKMTEH